MAIDNKTGIVILSRYSSSRLPGKALMPIKGKPVLAHITDRLLEIVPRDQIIIATSTETSDDKIAEFAHSQNIWCFRGSLEDVADRFYNAALQLNCTYACRINGDNIFLDKRVISDLIKIARGGAYDFLSNVKGRTYPKGMSVEIVRMSYYRELLTKIKADPYYREHVMIYLYELADEDRHYYMYNTSIPGAAGLHLALDTPEDLRRTKWMMERVEDVKLSGIVKLYAEYEQSIRG